MCRLRLMNSYEFENYLQEAITNYGNNLNKAEGLDHKESQKKAAKVFEKLLPESLKSRGQYLYHIINNTNAIIGMIWLGLVDNNLGFIYDFTILKSFRGQGLGEKAILLIEKKAKKTGVKKLKLQLFGHNLAAIGLYKKLGYQINNLNMSKEIK